MFLLFLTLLIFQCQTISGQVIFDCFGLAGNCFYEPLSCAKNRSHCEIFLQWTRLPNSELIHITLEYQGHRLRNKYKIGYVAFGVSTDDRMGDDTVVACTENYGVIPYANRDGHHSTEMLTDNEMKLLNKRINIEPNAIRCSFDHPITTYDGKSLIDGKKQIFIVNGKMNSPNQIGYHEHNVRVIKDVNFEQPVRSRMNLYQPSSYIAHAALELLAFVFCFPVAILIGQFLNGYMTKKFKFWQLHVAIALIGVLLAVIGVIIVVVEKSGYYVDKYRSKSIAYIHGVVGVSVLVVLGVGVIIGFVTAFMKKFHFCFRILHFILTVSAAMGGIATLFLGLELIRIVKPKYVFWILISFIIFFMLIHLLLWCEQFCRYGRMIRHTELKNDEKLSYSSKTFGIYGMRLLNGSEVPHIPKWIPWLIAVFSAIVLGLAVACIIALGMRLRE
ncbi:hypothetical protein SNEBB_006996 [Seison nebaliae]|nr:hypothetical protein SNEBB_006996 [Seison nebaliae]